MSEDKELKKDSVETENIIEVEDKNKKGKVKPIVVIIVSILLCGIFGVGGWYLGTKLADKENTKVNENKNDENESIETEDNKEETEVGVPEDEVTSEDEETGEDEEKEEFIPDETGVSTSVEEFEIALYDSKTILKSNYEITKRKVLDQDEKEIYVYALYREVYMNEKVVADKHMLGVYDTLKEAEDCIDSSAIKDYKTIKDSKTNDVYLVVDIEQNDRIYDNSITYYDSASTFTYIIDEQGKALTKIRSKYAGTGVIGVYVTEQEAKDRYYVIASDEDDVMFDHLDKSHKYVLYPNNRMIDLYDKHLYYFTYLDGEDCSSSEHKIVIENGKLMDTKVRSFDESLVSAAGQTC